MKTISTDKAPAAVGPYSQAKVVGSLLFASGQIPLNPATGTVVEGGIVEQTEQVCKNIEAVLTEAGTDFSKVVKTTCFLADIGDFKAFNEVYAKYFTSKWKLLRKYKHGLYFFVTVRDASCLRLY